MTNIEVMALVGKWTRIAEALRLAGKNFYYNCYVSVSSGNYRSMTFEVREYDGAKREAKAEIDYSYDEGDTATNIEAVDTLMNDFIGDYEAILESKANELLAARTTLANAKIEEA